MTSREAFEDHWASKTVHIPGPDGSAWATWQAAYEAGRVAEKQECKRVCELEINRLSAIGEHRAALAVGICAATIDARGKP